jgi:glyoxylase I family protein
VVTLATSVHQPGVEALEIAARHGCHPLRGVATYGDVYKLTYVRGPSGIIVMLAEELKKN